jgi:hypothetical protein
MAQNFAGFNIDQTKTLIETALGSKLPNNVGSDEITNMIQANVGLSAMLAHSTKLAQEAISKKVIGANEGVLATEYPQFADASYDMRDDLGIDTENSTEQTSNNSSQTTEEVTLPVEDPAKLKLDLAQTNYSTAQQTLIDAQKASAADPSNQDLAQAITDAQSAVTTQASYLQTQQEAYKAVALPNATELVSGALTNPADNITKTDVKIATDEQKTSGEIADGTGEAKVAETGTAITGTTASPVDAPSPIAANTYDASLATDEIKLILDELIAATGKPSEDALMEAATMSPEQLAQLGLTAAQIENAQKVLTPKARKVEEGEMIAGSTVDMDRVKEEINFEAATGTPSTDATVQGQLTGLMKDFEGKDPPPWAAGAMRAAAGAMAARGLSSSSIAGQAMIQAAMESAIPIATTDATTFATFERENLSRKQEQAMFVAEQRAKFMGVEFDQSFQTRVKNAATISEIANKNFDSSVTIALENARLANTVDIANLNAENALILSDAAAMTQVDVTNLTNRQLAAKQNAEAFLDMDIQNLSNEQQTSIIKAQETNKAILSDSAEENAAKQFNAKSQTQTDQFFEKLAKDVALKNNEQANMMSAKGAEQVNLMEQHNVTQKNRRDEFNASQSLAVAQANATWYQKIATEDNAAINAANRTDAMAANELTGLAFNAVMQESRDIMSYAWQTANNDADRAVKIAVSQLSSEDAQAAANATSNAGMWGALGSFMGAWVFG